MSTKKQRKALQSQISTLRQFWDARTKVVEENLQKQKKLRKVQRAIAAAKQDLIKQAEAAAEQAVEEKLQEVTGG